MDNLILILLNLYVLYNGKVLRINFAVFTDFTVASKINSLKFTAYVYSA